MSTITRPLRQQPITERIPAQGFLLTSAVFHYLGPAFAVLLFDQVSVLGVAWMRIAGAALVFALWRRPWRQFQGVPLRQVRGLIVFGATLAAMNACFYVAIDRLPLGTVGGIEFLGPIALAAIGVRSIRNLGALILAVAGVGLLADVRLSGEPIGFLFAGANCLLFVGYVVLGDRLAESGQSRIDRLAASMLVALIVISPVGLPGALPAFDRPVTLLAGLGVGICSSVIPYVCDQLALSRVKRATFALYLALLPASAALIGFAVLQQTPHRQEVLAIGLIVFGVAIHREPAPTEIGELEMA